MSADPNIREQKNVVVTGVSSGIGNAVARFLASKGICVFGSVRKEDDAAALVTELGDQFQPLVFDVCDATAVRRSATIVQKKLRGRRLQALVNNAGLALFGPMEKLDDDAFAHIMQVNVIGVRLVTNAFLPLLRENGSVMKDGDGPAKIVNVSSLSGIFNTPMNGAYCVSKHAMESLGEIYRRELKGCNIDVVSIRSGPIQSEIWRKNIVDDGNYDGTPYEALARNSQKIMRSAEKAALPPSVITRLVLDIIEGRKKKTAYELGRGATISRLFSSSFMPRRLADRLIFKALNK